MLIPYGTDASVYHPPIATVGVIAINAAMFLATGMGHHYGGESDWLILEYDRINPLQWVTAAFMHATWCHLIGNMIFLWCFGLIIEGKLGWQRFACLYLGLSLADGAIGQIPMFLFTDGQGGALGASGVIYALLAISMIWAPQNDIHFFYAWGLWFVGTIEIPIIVVGCFYIAVEFVNSTLVGWRMSTPVLHLLGATVGIPFAVFMLQAKLVDCEGWDLFTRMGWNSRLRPKHFNVLWVVGRLAETRPRKVEAEDAAAGKSSSTSSGKEPARPRPVVGDPTQGAPRDPCAAAIAVFNQHVSAGDVDGSIAAMDVLKRNSWVSGVQEAALVGYVRLLSKHSMTAESVLPLWCLVRRRSRRANDACVRIADIERKRGNFDEALSALQQMRQPMSQRQVANRGRVIRAIERHRLSSITNRDDRGKGDESL